MLPLASMPSFLSIFFSPLIQAISVHANKKYLNLDISQQ